MLTKSLPSEIKPEELVGKIFVAADGDGIGASVERAAMSDDLQAIMAQSRKIEAGQALIRRWAEERGGIVYIFGGDDVSFILPKEYESSLPDLKEEYHKETGFTITIGVGESVSQAGHAMLFGKLNGKNQINKWSPHLQDKLDSMVADITPEEKLRQEGLIKSIPRYTVQKPAKIGKRQQKQELKKKSLEQKYLKSMRKRIKI